MGAITDAIADVRAGRRSPRDVAKSVLTTGVALGLLLVLMFPVYWIVSVSLSVGTTLSSPGSLFGDPATYNLNSFRWVLENEAFRRGLLNSLIVVSVTVTVTLAFSIPGAYALSRREFLGRRKILYGYILFTQMGAGLSIAVLIALYALFSDFGLTNNLLVLGLFYAAGAIPFNTWLLKTFMDNIPVSYEEAAIVDGASQWQVIREVILPLSKPGIAAVLVFAWTAGWNEFIVAQTLIHDPDLYPLSVELYGIIDDRRGTPWPHFAAFALLFALPVAIIYFLAQKHVESGLSFGGMEG
ncbi:binding-protein-dependent transport systems inner membrane component [Haloterrigena turkmenica DSM 5511]|uniref:Binding-protein-dependent transport systems inner membrane component n=1 Tax=Haloterrigena turkmenica (strain ATCC 51198 / DSM 5511 / JCM 9101 / NCIMB 13204 / VKM B-1734 / 4k) TaxID=543526 RepID=D2RWM6_HALTV|nr:ABC transporter permease subunit [Haloterrigena turkmenica]ADB61527.1 binding-protein-dependent transport systems inner membrane component [Haloterrigena turkmenica DSM 5511]